MAACLPCRKTLYEAGESGAFLSVTPVAGERMTETAIPGEVLVDAAVAERATGHLVEGAGRRQLKGFADPLPLWSLTGAAPA